MKHLASPRFWRHYRELPESVRKLADKNFQLLKANPYHPSLHLKRIDRVWSVRVGAHYRALGMDARDSIVWFWIGSHADYDKLIWLLPPNKSLDASGGSVFCIMTGPATLDWIRAAASTPPLGRTNLIMTETNANVAIVVDPDFGDRLLSLAKEMPVWIADTPANRSRAESFWSHSDSGHPRLTTFRVAGNDAAEWCRTILPQVDLHHGEYSSSPAYHSVEVFGVSATPNLRDAFSDYGFTISTERADGFRAVR